jgi:hypothetical protein
MSKVIDLELNLPPSVDKIVDFMKETVLRRGEKGMANYGNIFGAGKTRLIDLTVEELDRMSKELSPKELDKALRERAKKAVTTLPQFIAQIDEAGVEWGVIEGGSHEETAKLIAKYPKRFLGTARVNPNDGMKAVRELERAVKELGMKCVYASTFRVGLPANDKRWYPIYAKAAELGIPVFIYSTMTYRTDVPMDIGHPRNVDEVAMDFPELKIVAGLGGWPWVPEMIGVARRHPNVYINTAAHRPKYFATPGSGWEMLMQFGNTLLQDQIIFASSWWTYGMPLKDVIAETRALPLKEKVKEKWLYENAARLFSGVFP